MTNRITKVSALTICLCLPLGACTQEIGDHSGQKEASDTLQGSEYYITADVLNVRLAPNNNATITNRLYRQQKVEVREKQGEWGRISKYYDGAAEGTTGEVARWVSMIHLARERPDDLSQPNIKKDPRITHMPKVGEAGLTEQDVRILYAGAKHYLQTGRCKKIEWGDKSVNKANTYYVNCGGPSNIFFTASDIPDIP